MNIRYQTNLSSVLPNPTSLFTLEKRKKLSISKLKVVKSTTKKLLSQEPQNQLYLHEIAMTLTVKNVSNSLSKLHLLLQKNNGEMAHHEIDKMPYKEEHFCIVKIPIEQLQSALSSIHTDLGIPEEIYEDQFDQTASYNELLKSITLSTKLIDSYSLLLSQTDMLIDYDFYYEEVIRLKRNKIESETQLNELQISSKFVTIEVKMHQFINDHFLNREKATVEIAWGSLILCFTFLLNIGLFITSAIVFALLIYRKKSLISNSLPTRQLS